ncbi:uncharacterized protein [Oryctolagus cuniculus]|uniref:uncharacterized protein isoform X1 n=1 Tax=Oryctolagus cuniculus TaxID=9986 RepID=UPI00387964AF
MDSRWRLDMNALRSRRAQERAELINKYEQGRRGAALLVPEEEDDEGGCLVPDRLGFLHEQKLPQDSTPGAKVRTSPWPWASHLEAELGRGGTWGSAVVSGSAIRSRDAVLIRHLLTSYHTHLSQK